MVEYSQKKILSPSHSVQKKSTYRAVISLGKLKQNTLRTFFLNKLLQIGDLIWKLDLNKYTKQLLTKFPRNCKDSIVGKPL